MSAAMSLRDLATAPPTMNVPQAGRYFGLTRAKAYQLHAEGSFPVPVLTLGQRYLVRTADLARALGLDPAVLLTDPPPTPVEAIDPDD